MLKKFLPALVVFVIFGLLPAFAFAAPSHQAKFVIGSASYEADGVSKQMDATPFIKNGRTYVPVRYLALALGVAEKDIGWDGATKTVTLKLDNVLLKLVIGSKTLYVDGQAKQMDVAPVIKSGRTYLPARWVAEAFGYEVRWDEAVKTVLVCPPGQVVEPEPKPASGKIDWDAAKNGTLQPPAGAVAPPDKWGFPAKAVGMEFKVGSRYAKVTRTDRSTYMLDLGTPCVVVTDKEAVDWLKSNYPSTYKPGTYVIVDDPKKEYWGVYVPFIPVAEAFGVPRENIVWDGQHLAVFGWDGMKEGYMVFKVGKREFSIKWHDGGVTTGNLSFPVFAKNEIPMMGMNSNNDFEATLLRSANSYCSFVNAWEGMHGGSGWDYETGSAGIAEGP